MNVNEAIEYIHSVCWKGTVPGLSRTQTLLEKMGNPEKKLKFVHIAGTNGKGSTASTSGCRWTAWRSPTRIWPPLPNM